MAPNFVSSANAGHAPSSRWRRGSSQRRHRGSARSRCGVGKGRGAEEPTCAAAAWLYAGGPNFSAAAWGKLSLSTTTPLTAARGAAAGWHWRGQRHPAPSRPTMMTLERSRRSLCMSYELGVLLIRRAPPHGAPWQSRRPSTVDGCAAVLDQPLPVPPPCDRFATTRLARSERALARRTRCAGCGRD